MILFKYLTIYKYNYFEGVKCDTLEAVADGAVLLSASVKLPSGWPDI